MSGKSKLGTEISDDALSTEFSRVVSGHHGVYFLVANEHKNILYKSATPDLTPLLNNLDPIKKINAENLFSWKQDNLSYRGSLIRFHTRNNKKFDDYFIVVAASTKFHLDYLKRFEENYWIVLIISLVIIFMVSWLAILLGHKPLRGISLQIRDIDTTQLHKRLDKENFPIEFQNLALELNQMLARIEDSYDQLSNFSSDIAHELRTPVTNLMTQTQVVLNKTRDSEAYFYIQT